MTTTEKTRESVQEKVAKLLAKAESTDSEHEAETFRNKALDLMAEWGIEAAMMDAGRTQAEREQVTENPMRFTGKYAKAMTVFGAMIAKGLGNVRAFESYKSGQTQRRSLHLVGHTSDVERARLLITSLQLQANTALRVWWKGFADKDWMTEAEKFRARRQFLFSFAEAAGQRLTESREQAEQEAATRSTTGSTATSSHTDGPGVALVLASRAQEVDAYMAEKYPSLAKGRAIQGSLFGKAEGAAAGRAANLGDRSSVGGGARAAIA